MATTGNRQSLASLLLVEAMDMSAGLGALKESQRHIEHRLGVAEATLASLATTISQTSTSPHRIVTDTPSMAPTDTTTPMDLLWLQYGKKALLWAATRLITLALPYILPGALIIWGLMKLLAGAAWRLVLG